ncbi:MAG TPA: NHL repeat-containing protein, partial [Agriterribacter sp.]|nr:NHL repeat-containing protein [Agriterribacter sp.]
MKPVFSLWIALMSFFVPFCLNAQFISTYAGTGQGGYSGNGGPATAAQLSDPLGVCADAAGNIYIADHSNHVIRKVSTDGSISNFAGSGEYGYSGDGGLAVDASLEYPFGLYADKSGNIYFTDRLRCVVRKVDGSGIITTVAGSGVSGYAGDGGLATNARLHAPMGIGGDGDGNIYIVEFVNLIVRKLSRDGVITTFAGNRRVGYTGDGGPAVNASFNSPVGIWVDEQGNVFVADTDNFAIRKINKSGTITTVAGNGTRGYTGDGGLAKAAQLKSPYGVYVNEKGELYIGDSGNGVIRKVNTSGIIETYAGNGIKDYSGDGGLPLDAAFIAPTFLCEDKDANLYIADGQSHVLRKIGACATVAIKSQPEDVSVCDAGGTTF